MATILTKKSDTSSSVPLAADLTNAAGGSELAVNTADKRLYTKTPGGTVVELGTNPSALSLPNGTANAVPYLNGSKVLTTGSALTFDGTNLGIGTSAPSAKLDVGSTNNPAISMDDSASGIARFSGAGYTFAIANNDTGTFLYNNGSSRAMVFGVNETERLRIDSSGNLGLGVTPSAWIGAGYQQFPGNGFIGNANAYSSNTLSSGVNAYYDTSWKYKATGTALRYDQNSAGAHAWFTAPSGTAGNAISFTQAMTLTASGNLGIGTSSPACQLMTNTSATGQIARFSSSAGSGEIQLNLGFTVNNQLSMFYDIGTGAGGLSTNVTTAPMVFRTSSTERLRIDSSGNVGIGTSSPFSKLTVVDAVDRSMDINGGGQLSIQGSGYVAGFALNAGGLNIYTNSTARGIIFGTNETERARIDSSGNLLVGTTSAALNIAQNGFALQTVSAYSVLSVGHASGTGSGAQFLQFSLAGTGIGSITQNGTTAVSYNTSSDYRLKNITGPITNSGAYIDSLNPVEGTWKADGSTFVGLIAHEVQEASRTQVATGVKDGEEMQGMDYSSAEIIANLIAEVKSLRTRVAALEAA